MSFHFFSQINSGCRALCAAFVLGALVMAGTVSAATCRVTVTGAGSNDGTTWANAMTLQTALNSPACDEVWVKAGTYTPTDDGDRAVSFNILPGVEVYGGFAGTESQRDARDPVANLTTLSGDLNGDDGPDFANNDENSLHVVLMDGTQGIPITGNTVLDGFTISGGNDSGTSDYSGGGLYCDGSGNGNECSPSLSNVTFSGNKAFVGGAMYNEAGTAVPAGRT